MKARRKRDVYRTYHRRFLSNLVNKAKLVHNLFLVYLSISTCLVRLCAHHQENQLNLCDTWYLLFFVDDCLVCIPDSHPYSCFSWWWAHIRPKRVEVDKYKYTKNELCTKLVLFTRLYRNARSTKHEIQKNNNVIMCTYFQHIIQGVRKVAVYL
jgi:hypothetical protein